MAAQAGSQPDAVALVEYGGPQLTWAELEDRCTAAASALSAHGLLAGQRVGLLGGNSIAWAVAWFGVLRAGLVAVPINPQSSPDEVRNVLSHSGARVLLTDRAVETGLPVLELASSWQPAGPVSSPRDPDALAVLLYTAGTSGRPKAVMLTHRSLLAHCANADSLGQLRTDDVVFSVLPLFHVFGLNAVLDMAAYLGLRLVLSDGLPADLGAVVRDHRVTVLPLAPLAIHRLLESGGLDQLSSLRLVLSGAAPLSAKTAAEFSERAGVALDQGYGLTEAAPGVATTLGGDQRGGGHVGRALPGVQIRIGDGLDNAEPANVFVRGANLFSGYWPGGAGGPDADGWFDTGDIGYLDGPGSDLFLVDRSRELILVNGFNVYPAEVEEVIAEVAGVQAVAVVGRDDRRTERVVAFVVGDVTGDQVRAHCDVRLARFKRPTMINIVPDLPRGVTGKIKKGALREQLDVLR